MTAALATRQTFDALRREDEVGEWWSARDLMLPLGYERWERFEDAIQRAELAAAHLGEDAPDHFRGAAKKVEIGSGAVRVVADYRLTRFGSYLLAMNGDPRKPEIAAAQTYFAVQTRRAEVAQRELSRLELIDLAREAELERIAEQERRELAEAKVAELAPIAAAAQDLIASSGDYSVEAAAKILCRAGINTGERKLFATLRQIGWLIDSHTPYQTAINSGRLAVRASTFWHEPTQEFRVSRQVRVTAKGLATLHRMLGGDSLLAITP